MKGRIIPARYIKELKAYEHIRDNYPSDTRRRTFHYVRLLRAERAIYKNPLDKAVIRKEIIGILNQLA